MFARWRPSIVAVLAFSGLWLSGCGQDVPFDSVLVIERPQGRERIPVAIGIYFSPEFLAFEQLETDPGEEGIADLRLRFGQASADMFDGVFNAAFQEVRFVKGRPPLVDTGASPPLVVEPRIERANITRPPTTATAGEWIIELTYLLKFFDREGNTVMSWTVAGRGGRATRDGPVSMIGWGLASPATASATEQAGKHLMKRLYNDNEFAAWREKNVAASGVR